MPETEMGDGWVCRVCARVSRTWNWPGDSHPITLGFSEGLDLGPLGSETPGAPRYPKGLTAVLQCSLQLSNGGLTLDPPLPSSSPLSRRPCYGHSGSLENTMRS